MYGKKMFTAIFIVFLLFLESSQEVEVKRICARNYSNEAHISVDEDVEPQSTDSQDSGIEICKPGIYYCYTLWKDTKLPNNSTSLVILAQGCWEASGRGDCTEESCSGTAAKAMQDTGFCCCSADLCNVNITRPPPLPLASVPPPHLTQIAGRGGQEGKLVALSVCGVVIVVLVVAALVRRRGLKAKSPPPSHAPLLLHHTSPITHLTLDKIVGQGRYGTVWLGSVRDQQVAIKMFPLHYSQYYYNEKDIYTLPFMDHPNLLTYYGCDERLTKEGVSSYVLVLSYCPNGTLQEFLRANTVDLATFCRMALSVSAGLSHLHTEIRNADKWKPCVTHRDVNTKNILVKGDLSCALCDLGLGVKITGSHYYTLGEQQHAETKSINDVGTLRYMAPEVLEGAVNLRDCESSLKQIDVYALGLVLWELATRTHELYSSSVPPYALPFEKEVGLQPSLEQMQTAVCRNKARPLFSNDWRHWSSPGRLIRETVEDCTDQDGEARLTALCVHERLSQLHRGCGNTTGVSPTVNLTNCQFPAPLHNNNNNSNYTNNNTENSGDKDMTDGGVSEGTVETMVTISPSESFHQPIHNNMGDCIGVALQAYQGRNPCLERNLLREGIEEVAVVQTSSKHHHQPKQLNTILAKPLRRLIGKKENRNDSEGGRLIVSPFEEDPDTRPEVQLEVRREDTRPDTRREEVRPDVRREEPRTNVRREEADRARLVEARRNGRPGSLELERSEPLKEISARVKTPGDLPPSVRKKRARLSLYDDRIMSGDSSF